MPHERDPGGTYTPGALGRLIADPSLRARLGRDLRRKVERDYAVGVVVRRWEALFDEVAAEAGR